MHDFDNFWWKKIIPGFQAEYIFSGPGGEISGSWSPWFGRAGSFIDKRACILKQHLQIRFPLMWNSTSLPLLFHCSDSSLVTHTFSWYISQKDAKPPDFIIIMDHRNNPFCHVWCWIHRFTWQRYLWGWFWVIDKIKKPNHKLNKHLSARLEIAYVLQQDQCW